MNRRTFLHSTAAAAVAAATLDLSAAAPKGRFAGKIRKSLKWNMVQQAKGIPVAEAFKKLRECGYEGVEPNITPELERSVDEWIAASKTSGLIIDGTVSPKTEDLEVNIDFTKKIGAESMLVVARYDQKEPIVAQWNRCRDQLKAAAPHAAKQRIKVLVENVWATFLISPFDMARFIDEVGSPWVQVHFDIGNMMRWGVAEHWAQVLGKRSQKLDVKEYDLKKAMNEGMSKGFDVPMGEGSINWAAVRDELAKINFQGWAAAEVRGGNWERLTEVSRQMDRVLDLV
jgi:L-ribulose-5-phosphate 3-epimerase